ncbi:hypothetical protein ABXS75_03710 [Roseburia hominis]
MLHDDSSIAGHVAGLAAAVDVTVFAEANRHIGIAFHIAFFTAAKDCRGGCGAEIFIPPVKDGGGFLLRIAQNDGSVPLHVAVFTTAVYLEPASGINRQIGVFNCAILASAIQDRLRLHCSVFKKILNTLVKNNRMAICEQSILVDRMCELNVLYRKVPGHLIPIFNSNLTFGADPLRQGDLIVLGSDTRQRLLCSTTYLIDRIIRKVIRPGEYNPNSHLFIRIFSSQRFDFFSCQIKRLSQGHNGIVGFKTAVGIIAEHIDKDDCSIVFCAVAPGCIGARRCIG